MASLGAVPSLDVSTCSFGVCLGILTNDFRGETTMNVILKNLTSLYYGVTEVYGGTTKCSLYKDNLSKF